MQGVFFHHFIKTIKNGFGIKKDKRTSQMERKKKQKKV